MKELFSPVVTWLQPTKDRVQHSPLMFLGKACMVFPTTRRECTRTDGFTIVELMIVLSLIAILTSLATPSFARLVQAAKISSATNMFLSDIRFARSEAIRRGGGVVICRSDFPEATDPVCADGTAGKQNGWASGWIVFQDLANNGVKTLDDPLLRVQAPLASINAIKDSNVLSTRFRFTATGRLVNANSATSLVFGAGPSFATDVQRTVCIDLGGSARTVGDGAATCAWNSP